MVTKRIYLAWLVSVSIGTSIALATSITAYVLNSFGGFVIGSFVSFALYCIIFHSLCLWFVPNINTLIDQDTQKAESITTTFTTQYHHTGDVELDKYIDRYMEARLISKNALAVLAIIAVIIALALISSYL